MIGVCGRSDVLEARFSRYSLMISGLPKTIIDCPSMRKWMISPIESTLAAGSSFARVGRLAVLRYEVSESVPRPIAWGVEQIADHREGWRSRGKGSSTRACAPFCHRADVHDGEQGENQRDNWVDVETETHVAGRLEDSEGIILQSRLPVYYILYLDPRKRLEPPRGGET